MKYLVLLTMICLAVTAVAQSRRAAPQPSATPPGSEMTVKAMFDEVNGYNKAKFAEFEAKKIPYSEKLRIQTEREQRQLAAKYAAMAGTRKNVAGEDLYYAGLLHWVAENLDRTGETLLAYLASEQIAPERAQTARSIIAVAAAKQRKLDEALAANAEYLKNSPIKLSDRTRMEGEIAKAYFAQKKWAESADHAEQAYHAAKAVLTQSGLTQRGLDETLDTAMQLFESRRASGDQKAADAVLGDLRQTAAAIGSPSLYAYAADKLIVHMIDTGRKPLALETFSSALTAAAKDMPSKAKQDEAANLLKKRERQYKLLGEAAPELDGVDQWFSGKARSLTELRGRVVLLDFWATWCGPCFDAFPSLVEWHRDLSENGLVILGVTRYYGNAGGLPVDNAGEIEFLKTFKAKQGLPYDFVVTDGQASQFLFAATALPTTVLIDRKGVVRYIESGTNPTRVEELRQAVMRLLAEK